MYKGGIIIDGSVSHAYRLLYMGQVAGLFDIFLMNYGDFMDFVFVSSAPILFNLYFNLSLTGILIP